MKRIEGLMMDTFSGLSSDRDAKSTGSPSPGRNTWEGAKSPRGSISSEFGNRGFRIGSDSNAEPAVGELSEARATEDEPRPSVMKELTKQGSGSTSTSDSDKGSRTPGPIQTGLLAAVSESSRKTIELPSLGGPRSAPTIPRGTRRPSHSNAVPYIARIDSEHSSCDDFVTHKDLDGLEDRLMGHVSNEVCSPSHMPTSYCEIYFSFDSSSDWFAGPSIESRASCVRGNFECDIGERGSLLLRHSRRVRAQEGSRRRPGSSDVE